MYESQTSINTMSYEITPVCLARSQPKGETPKKRIKNTDNLEQNTDLKIDRKKVKMKRNKANNSKEKLEKRTLHQRTQNPVTSDIMIAETNSNAQSELFNQVDHSNNMQSDFRYPPI